jgi:hypothetical protein
MVVKRQSAAAVSIQRVARGKSARILLQRKKRALAFGCTRIQVRCASSGVSWSWVLLLVRGATLF